jgi:hypothetical protein
MLKHPEICGYLQDWALQLIQYLGLKSREPGHFALCPENFRLVRPLNFMIKFSQNCTTNTFRSIMIQVLHYENILIYITYN